MKSNQWKLLKHLIYTYNTSMNIHSSIWRHNLLYCWPLMIHGNITWLFGFSLHVCFVMLLWGQLHFSIMHFSVSSLPCYCKSFHFINLYKIWRRLQWGSWSLLIVRLLKIILCCSQTLTKIQRSSCFIKEKKSLWNIHYIMQCQNTCTKYSEQGELRPPVCINRGN